MTNLRLKKHGRMSAIGTKRHAELHCTCPLWGVKRTTGGQTVSVLLIKRRLAALDLALDSGKH